MMSVNNSNKDTANSYRRQMSNVKVAFTGLKQGDPGMLLQGGELAPSGKCIPSQEDASPPPHHITTCVDGDKQTQRMWHPLLQPALHVVELSLQTGPRPRHGGEHPLCGSVCCCVEAEHGEGAQRFTVRATAEKTPAVFVRVYKVAHKATGEGEKRIGERADASCLGLAVPSTTVRPITTPSIPILLRSLSTFLILILPRAAHW